MPYAISGKKENALLRKLQNPLYDTTVIDASVATDILQFFVRPQGQPMPVAGGAKTNADTNLQSASMLGEPLEFDVVGFNYEYFNLEPESQDAGNALDIASDEILIWAQSFFRFKFNNRTFLECPLRQLPSGTALTGTVATGDTTNQVQFAYLHWGKASVTEYYNFTINDPDTGEPQMYKIHSAEPFFAEVRWPNAAIDMNTNNDERFRTYIQGYLYQNL